MDMAPVPRALTTSCGRATSRQIRTANVNSRSRLGGEVRMSQGAKPASQARSRATRDRLVAALDGLLREKDFESITIADLAREAGLAVGTVYRRFENKAARGRLKKTFQPGNLCLDRVVYIM